MLHGYGVEEYAKLNDSIYWRDATACTSICSFRPSSSGRRRGFACGRRRDSRSRENHAHGDRGGPGDDCEFAFGFRDGYAAPPR